MPVPVPAPAPVPAPPAPSPERRGARPYLPLHPYRHPQGRTRVHGPDPAGYPPTVCDPARVFTEDGRSCAEGDLSGAGPSILSDGHPAGASTRLAKLASGAARRRGGRALGQRRRLLGVPSEDCQGQGYHHRTHRQLGTTPWRRPGLEQLCSHKRGGGSRGGEGHDNLT